MATENLQTVAVEKMSEAEEALHVANGFASLKSKKLPVKGLTWVCERVNAEFQEWLEQRMNQVMKATGTPDSAFTPEEAAALKAMAKQILARQAAAPSAPAEARSLPSGPALKPAVDHKKVREGNQKILSVASQIAAMEDVRDSTGKVIEF
jgi:hypothetical protein